MRGGHAGSIRISTECYTSYHWCTGGVIWLVKNSWLPVILPRIGAKGLIRTHYAAIRHEDAGKKYITDFIKNLHEELTS